MLRGKASVILLKLGYGVRSILVCGWPSSSITGLNTITFSILAGQSWLHSGIVKPTEYLTMIVCMKPDGIHTYRTNRAIYPYSKYLPLFDLCPRVQSTALSVVQITVNFDKSPSSVHLRYILVHMWRVYVLESRCEILNWHKTGQLKII